MAERGLKVVVLGAAGYVGGELLRLLLRHPAVAEVRGASKSHAGRAFADAHPALRHAAPGTFDEPDPAAAGAFADAVFLALPHGESQKLVTTVLREKPDLLVDLAADFRVRDLDLFEAFYGEHREPSLPATFTYGLADTLGRSLEGVRRIAAPGCFATAALLALWPFAQKGGFARPPILFAATGSSGSGVSPKRTTHHPVRAHNLFAYSLTGHRHEAEIIDRLRDWTGDAAAGATLIPHSAPIVRGIHLTLSGTPAEPVADPLDLLRKTYAGRPFIRILTDPPELSAVVGTNFAHLHAAARKDGSVVVTVAIDNLVKGAAGQAVQAMNLALGLEETAGLTFPGLYPC